MYNNYHVCIQKYKQIFLQLFNNFQRKELKEFIQKE